MKKPPKNKLNSIEKTLEILIAFAESNHELGTVELSELTGIHKATTSRILSTLLDFGIVTKNFETRKYYLGPLVYRLATTRSSQWISALVALSKPHIDELRDRIDENISLEVWAENKTIACYIAECKNPVRVAEMAVDVLPLHAPAGAKAILSFISVEHVKRLLPERFPKLTENTTTTRSEFLSRLKAFNKQGYSVDNEELYNGVYALGVPVFDQLSRPVSAVSAILPATRAVEEREAEIVNELKRTSRIISGELKKGRISVFSVAH